MIPQLEKRLTRAVKKMEQTDEAYKSGIKPFELYFVERFDIDKEIARIYELNRKKVREQEFNESQLDFLVHQESV